MSAPRLIFRVHAIRRMVQRGISVAEVRHVLTTGQVIEDYPNDVSYPSRLILGWYASRPLHVVAADNTTDQETIIITAYEPDPGQWDASFTKRVP